jgi:hypothetical protein
VTFSAIKIEPAQMPQTGFLKNCAASSSHKSNASISFSIVVLSPPGRMKASTVFELLGRFDGAEFAACRFDMLSVRFDRAL